MATSAEVVAGVEVRGVDVVVAAPEIGPPDLVIVWCCRCNEMKVPWLGVAAERDRLGGAEMNGP